MTGNRISRRAVVSSIPAAIALVSTTKAISLTTPEESHGRVTLMRRGSYTIDVPGKEPFNVEVGRESYTFEAPKIDWHYTIRGLRYRDPGNLTAAERKRPVFRMEQSGDTYLIANIEVINWKQPFSGRGWVMENVGDGLVLGG